MNGKVVGMVFSVLIIMVMVVVIIKTNMDTRKSSNDLSEYPSGLIEDLPDNIQDESIDYESGIENGNMAPDFELHTLDGKKVKLSDYKGQNVILNFWASWCPPCRVEMPYMEKYYQQYSESANVEILAVNMTTIERGNEDIVTKFVDEHNLTFPILMDVDGDAMDLYEVMAYPTTYIINEEGFITNRVLRELDDKLIKELVDNIN